MMLIEALLTAAEVFQGSVGINQVIQAQGPHYVDFVCQSQFADSNQNEVSNGVVQLSELC